MLDRREAIALQDLLLNARERMPDRCDRKLDGRGERKKRATIEMPISAIRLDMYIWPSARQ
jgi:hypothetical protein